MQRVTSHLRYLLLLGLLLLGALNRRAMTALQSPTAILRLRDLHRAQLQLLSYQPRTDKASGIKAKQQ